MNRIVIIGNGFDLAQGLKTSYEDFLVDLIKTQVFNLLKNKKEYDTTLFKVECLNSHPSVIDEPLKDVRTFEQLCKNVAGVDKKMVYTDNSKSYKFTFSTNSSFFRSLIGNKTWTDIEKAYYNQLLALFGNIIGSNFREDLVKLNSDFAFLKTKLIEYLKKTTEHYNERNYFDSPFRTDLENCIDPEKTQTSLSQYVNKIDLCLFLNFNYTNTLKPFIERNLTNCREIQIHGNMNNPDSIIFGYGDDTSNSKYKELEDADIRELLENFKSIHYPKTKHYNYLMDIVESNPFDVIVLGHSMGLSDRVLLESIFEHENCKAIRLFHRGNKRSFEDKVIAISRHFKDKQKMRRKIVDFDPNDVLGGFKE
ncbi:MAG: hypothetical protein FGM14_02110 [Flavobacteriales bacterium]|nr:hypothetical protein [Flavobacteriales bacterium]